MVAEHRDPAMMARYLVELVAVALGIPAWILGQTDLKKMSQGIMDPSGKGLTMTGMIMGT